MRATQLVTGIDLHVYIRGSLCELTASAAQHLQFAAWDSTAVGV